MRTRIDASVVALRPVRIVNDTAVHYTATTFPNDPRGGCELALRRCDAFGYLANELGDLWVDLLDDIGDIVQEVPLTRRGFEYLRRTLRFRRERMEG